MATKRTEYTVQFKWAGEDWIDLHPYPLSAPERALYNAEKLMHERMEDMSTWGDQIKYRVVQRTVTITDWEEVQ